MRVLREILTIIGLAIVLGLALLGVAFIDHALEFNDVFWMQR